MSAPVGGGGVGPKVNKFEQVSSLGYQMSLPGETWGLYSKVQYIMGNGHMGPSSPRRYNDWLTDRHDRKHYFPTTSLAGSKRVLKIT